MEGVMAFDEFLHYMEGKLAATSREQSMCPEACPYHTTTGIDIDGEDIGTMSDDVLVYHLGGAERHVENSQKFLGEPGKYVALLEQLKKEADRRRELKEWADKDLFTVKVECGNDEDKLLDMLTLREMFRVQGVKVNDPPKNKARDRKRDDVVDSDFEVKEKVGTPYPVPEPF